MRRALGFTLIAVLTMLATACSSGHKKSEAPPAESTTTSIAGESTTSSVATPTTTSPTTAPVPPTTARPVPATTTPPAPQIIAFTGPTGAVLCNAPTSVELHWMTRNATSVSLAIDGKPFATFTKPNFDGLQPLACTNRPHTYTLTAHGARGTTATATRTFVGRQAP